MSTPVMTNRLELNSVAETALKAAARFWFGVTVIGQLVFAFAVASFYSLTSLRGDYHSWRFSNGFGSLAFAVIGVALAVLAPAKVRAAGS